MTRRRHPTFVEFCVQTLRLKLTDAWRVLLLVTIDGVQPSRLSGRDREIALQLFGPVDVIDPELRAIIVWRLGRSSGKSTIAAALAIWSALTVDLSDVGPGQIPHAFVVSPSRPLAKIAIAIAEALIVDTPVEARRIDGGGVPDGFLLKRWDNRVVAVQAVAASKGGANVRGVDVIVLVLDESEFFASGESGDYAVTDRDQIAAATPRLIGHVLCISTPWPTENVTAEYFDRNHGHPVDAVAAVGTSMFMRPSAKLAAAIERERKRDPENAAREYDVEPGARGGSKLFDAESIKAAIVEGRPLTISAARDAYVGAGGDLGLERDSSAIAIVSNLAGAFDLLEADEIRPAKGSPLTPGYVIRDRFAPIMARHGASVLSLDAFYRQSAVEHLDALNLRFEPAPEGNQGKYDTYMFARGLLRAGALRIPPMPRLVAQLRAVTQTPLPNRGVRISSPRRAGQGHGDLVSALVLGCWQARDAKHRRTDRSECGVGAVIRLPSFDERPIGWPEYPTRF